MKFEIMIGSDMNDNHLFLDTIILDWGDLADGSYLLDAVPNAVKVNVYIRR